MIANPIKRTVGSHAAAIALALAAPASYAAQPPQQAPAQPVELHGEVKVETTVVENGVARQVLADPSVVVPGDRLIFTTTYRNTGAAPAEVSVDGGRTWGVLASLKVSDGKGGQRAAAPGDATHVRWTLPVVPPRATGTISFHAAVR